MKEKIFTYIKEHPGCRQREMASDLNVWLCSKEFLNALQTLDLENRIYSVIYHDSANMEFYLQWYVAD